MSVRFEGQAAATMRFRELGFGIRQKGYVEGLVPTTPDPKSELLGHPFHSTLKTPSPNVSP